MAFIHLEVYQITEAANRLATSDINKGVSTVVQGVMEEVVNQLYTTCSATGREGGIASAHTKKRECGSWDTQTGCAPQNTTFIDIDRDLRETATIGLSEARTTPRFGDRREQEATNINVKLT